MKKTNQYILKAEEINSDERIEVGQANFDISPIIN